MAFTIIIKNIKNPNEIKSKGIKNKYKGAYEKIFNILNENAIFIEANVEKEELYGNDFYLYFNFNLSVNELEEISKIKNVTIY